MIIYVHSPPLKEDLSNILLESKYISMTHMSDGDGGVPLVVEPVIGQSSSLRCIARLSLVRTSTEDRLAPLCTIQVYSEKKHNWANHFACAK